MMEQLNFSILEKIFDMTKIGRYVIVSVDEFFENDDENSVAALKKALGELRSQGYIDLKYSGEDMFCVAPLKNLPEPPPAEQQCTPAGKRRAIKLPDFRTAFLGGALGGFVGSMLGGLIITVIFAAVYAR